mmetsp:Transcript_17575/g.52054  ORF Transcript_17575/g.52054 Transcript_17575/m.52054 type:complete len:437 (+) Transcript_17575:115-1425(+)
MHRIKSAGQMMSSRRRNYILHSHRKDKFLEWIRELLTHSFVLDIMSTTLKSSWEHIEKLVDEVHKAQAAGLSWEKMDLAQLCPGIGIFHTPLPLAEAFEAYDSKYHISKRRFVRPSFNEVRHILNLAQMWAIAEDLKLLTLDGDCTLYADGKAFEDRAMGWSICRLLNDGVYVALVTAAGYGLDAVKYEARIALLLQAFTEFGLSAEAKGRFFVLGGECNYLLQCGPNSRLVALEETEWNDGKILHGWKQSDVDKLLDTANATFVDAIGELGLRARIIRKERAVGMIALDEHGKVENPKLTATLRRELLDECVLRIHDAIKHIDTPLPFCAFNGGSDVWVDIGNKSVGVSALQEFLEVKQSKSLHLGDQFSVTGNDKAARNVAATLWVIAPIETAKCLRTILGRRGIACDDKGMPAAADSEVGEGAGVAAAPNGGP